MSEKREGTTQARPEEIRKGVVQPEKPTKLPNVAPPRPVSTTTPPPNSKKP